MFITLTLAKIGDKVSVNTALIQTFRVADIGGTTVSLAGTDSSSIWVTETPREVRDLIRSAQWALADLNAERMMFHQAKNR